MNLFSSTSFEMMIKKILCQQKILRETMRRKQTKKFNLILGKEDNIHGKELIYTGYSVAQWCFFQIWVE